MVWRYLRDPTFSRFDKIPECDGHTHTQRERDGHTTMAYTALSIASHGKKRRITQIMPHDRPGTLVFKLDVS